MENITIAVIGGSGFLGQHIVRELQKFQEEKDKWTAKQQSIKSEPQPTASALQSDDELLGDCCRNFGLLEKKNIKLIKILDINEFKPVIDISSHPPVHYEKCDIRFESKVFEKLEGVDAVIHCAVLFPNFEDETKEHHDLMWETNLEGTENVIYACRRANVRVLLYTSSIVVVMGGEKIVLHTEPLTPKVHDKELILGVYAKTRKRAETVVLDAHNTTTEGGKKFVTTALRPVFLYGEGDTRNIPNFIKLARKAGGSLPLMHGENLQQFAYVGNAAVAHVEAVFTLLRGESHPLRDCGGLPVYINDDSPSGPLMYILDPFLSEFNLSVKDHEMPYFVVLFGCMIINMWNKFWERLGSPSKLKGSVPSLRLQKLFSTITVVNRTRAEMTFNYKPIYGWEVAKESSVNYYKRLLGK